MCDLFSILTFLLGSFLGWWFGKASERRIIEEQKKSTEKIIKIINELKYRSIQLDDDLRLGRKENYIEKDYPDIGKERRKKKIVLSVLVQKKIEKEAKSVQQAVEKALRRLAEGIYFPLVKKLSQGKFYVCRVGKYRLVFEEKEDRILVVDFVKRTHLPKTLKEIDISNA